MYLSAIAIVLVVAREKYINDPYLNVRHIIKQSLELIKVIAVIFFPFWVIKKQIACYRYHERFFRRNFDCLESLLFGHCSRGSVLG